MAPYWKLAGRRLFLVCALPLLVGGFIAIRGWFWFVDVSSFAENARGCEGRILTTETAGGRLNLEVEYPDEEGKLYRAKFHIADSQRERLRSTSVIAMVHDRRYP